VSRTFELWHPYLRQVALVCGGFFGLALAARLRRSVPLAVACLALVLPALLGVTARGFAAYAEARSSRALAHQILELPRGTDVACMRCFPSSLPFYLGRPVTLVSDDASELRSNYVDFRVTRDGIPPPGVVRRDGLEAWLAGHREPVYLLASDDEQQALAAVAAERGVGVTQLAPGLWAALLPPSAGS
jgi:hypothetical protein